MPIDLTDPPELIAVIAERSADMDRPFLAALDGRSGSGKSTLAAALAEKLAALVIEGDDFYAGGTELRLDGPAARAADCIDWTRQRPIVHALRAGREAVWRAFDWDAFDGRLRTTPTRRAPKPVVILEGVYSARPELADLLDLRVLLTVPDAVRAARLSSREGSIGAWERQWHEAEDHYFRAIMPREAFDVVMEPRPRGWVTSGRSRTSFH